MKKDCCKNWYKYIPLFSVLFIVAVIAFSFIVMSLWNWLIPALFNGPMITMWQAIGLLILSKILFGSFSHGHGKCCKHHSSHRAWEERCGEKFKEYAADSDEEKTADSE